VEPVARPRIPQVFGVRPRIDHVTSAALMGQHGRAEAALPPQCPPALVAICKFLGRRFSLFPRLFKKRLSSSSFWFHAGSFCGPCWLLGRGNANARTDATGGKKRERRKREKEKGETEERDSCQHSGVEKNFKDFSVSFLRRTFFIKNILQKI
jgi:hypothetical protein